MGSVLEKGLKYYTFVLGIVFPELGATERLAATAGVAGGAVETGAIAAAKSAGALGREGEGAVRGAYDIGEKPTKSILMNGRARLPDGLSKDVLSEVKNVDSLSFTRQLRDYSDFSQKTGRSFDLYTRPGTQLSGPLRDAIDSGLINNLHIP